MGKRKRRRVSTQNTIRKLRDSDKPSIKKSVVSKKVHSSPLKYKKNKHINKHLKTIPKKKKVNKSKSFRKKKKQKISFFYELLISLLVATIIICATCFFLFGFVKMRGYGMTPTVSKGSYLFYSKIKKISRFDLVVINRGNSKQVRRVIALPGENLEYKDDSLYIDGKIIDEKFIVEEINQTQKYGGQYTSDFQIQELIKESEIPGNSFFLLGDNRPYGTDSRDYGLVEKSDILGVVLFQFLPLGSFQVF